MTPDCDCIHMPGRYPEGAVLPAANGYDINNAVYVGNHQACRLNIKNGYMYCCAWTSEGAKAQCPNYKPRKE